MNRIEQLIRVQELDLARDELVRERDGVPEKIAAARAPLDGALASERTARENLQLASRARERLEKDIDFERSKLDERERKLRQVKTNEEFQAGQKELAEQRKRITAMEDDVLGHMETAEALQREIQRSQGDADRVRAAVESVEGELRGRTAEIETRIAAFDRELAESRQALDRATLGLYDMLRSRRGGTAVAEIRGGICQACRTRIPSQMYNELHSPDIQHICPNCNRIIFVRIAPKAPLEAEATG